MVEGLILGAVTAFILRQIVLPAWVAFRALRG